MAGGLAALLDDVAAIAKVAAANVDDVAVNAAKTSAKAAGVVVDDAAVTPQYVSGVTPAREIPIIWRIAKGSLVNKLVFILPVALALSVWAPWALTPILMLGGSFLCFEGMEKVIEKFSGDHSHAASVQTEPQDENKLVRSAITTDLILSAEIMVISLNAVTDLSFPMRTAVLVLVAIGITLLVYGAVGLLVKMDDIGLRMAAREDAGSQKMGRALVDAMPKLLTAIAVIGTFAMLWVGGHIVLVGLAELGWTPLYGFVHHLETMVPAGFLAWCVNTFFSLILGAVWGGIIAGIVHVTPLKRSH
ncbi:DUF808 domain-containing protein [Corynebacterium hindlerae]|uniref:DUF808 domain-containing protein n=1 Tax=Corynebacterium hindlerae TaxID=699041 RepID=A0A7G5FGD9_9CORY|nr:DUF808 domain-containing protein [Corynebacterium hindlerae]QMV85680.1 DUF808 domain-containing protein [Corynebacterium hindlerae]